MSVWIESVWFQSFNKWVFLLLILRVSSILAGNVMISPKDTVSYVYEAKAHQETTITCESDTKTIGCQFRVRDANHKTDYKNIDVSRENILKPAFHLITVNSTYNQELVLVNESIAFTAQYDGNSSCALTLINIKSHRYIAGCRMLFENEGWKYQYQAIRVLAKGKQLLNARLVMAVNPRGAKSFTSLGDNITVTCKTKEPTALTNCSVLLPGASAAQKSKDQSQKVVDSVRNVVDTFKDNIIEEVSQHTEVRDVVTTQSYAEVLKKARTARPVAKRDVEAEALTSDVEMIGSNLTAGTCDRMIPSLKETHSGVFWCEAANESHYVGSKAYTLIMPSKPTEVILEPNGTEMYKVGDTLIARCTVLGSRPAATVTWHLDGQVYRHDGINDAHDDGWQWDWERQNTTQSFSIKILQGHHKQDLCCHANYNGTEDIDCLKIFAYQVPDCSSNMWQYIALSAIFLLVGVSCLSMCVFIRMRAKANKGAVKVTSATTENELYSDISSQSFHDDQIHLQTMQAGTSSSAGPDNVEPEYDYVDPETFMASPAVNPDKNKSELVNATAAPAAEYYRTSHMYEPMPMWPMKDHVAVTATQAVENPMYFG